MDVERDRNGVAWVTLDRPPMNAFDEEAITSFADAVRALGADPTVRVVVVTGRGQAFSVGLDLTLLGRGFEDPSYFRAQLERFGDALSAFEALEVPTIACVNGTARAGGFELLLCADLVLVADDARVGDTHLASGLPPGGGASARLPRRVGHQHARDLLLTGRWISGTDAASIGLAARAVPAARLRSEVQALVERLAASSRPALAATKQILRASEHVPLDEALRIELEAFTRFLHEEPSAAEGYRAFVERRDARWP